MNQSYEFAKEKYSAIGVDTEAAIAALSNIPISIQCWQGDDVSGFLFNEELSGGIQVTGNYPGKARTADELREDIALALSLIPGKHRLNLHAIYADTTEKVDLDALEPRHFEAWVKFAKEKGIGLDFNPTCFSHPMAADGLTVSHPDKNVREFWVEHCRRCRKIAEYFAKELGSRCSVNFWFPDGSKDTPIDRAGPRIRMKESLDAIFDDPSVDSSLLVDAVESKLFGIGAESYTVGSNEFCLAYAAKAGIAVCLDAGHFHPTETISDKISSVLLSTDELLLHVSRPVRWDSDHVVILDDELRSIATALVRGDYLSRTHLALDYFDASINRIAAWVIGVRNFQKALLLALLEPYKMLLNAELERDFTTRLALTEELKSYPFGEVWDEFCRRNNVPVGKDWLDTVKKYEKDILLNR